MVNNFNIRIYAILIHDGCVLALKEPYAGQQVVKLPGGGLEFGEGSIECLKREFLEELNLTINVDNHFYTQDFFVESWHKPNNQLMNVYYKVSALNIHKLKIIDSSIEELLWLPLKNLSIDNFSLPVDKVAIGLLLSSN